MFTAINLRLQNNVFATSIFIIIFTSWRITDSYPVVDKQKAQGLFQDPDVFMTISPEANYSGEGTTTVLFDRRIVLNWYNFFDQKPGDYVGIYVMDPRSVKGVTATETVQVNDFTGYYRTSVRYVRQNLTATSNQCLGYWIAYVRVLADNQTEVLKSQCLMIYPTWMRDLKATIGDKPLTSIMIPGTHNAGSWTHYEGKATENILTNYVMCQEDSVYQQLIHGVRYVDIRVAHYPQTIEKFWVNHDAFKVRPLSEVISDVRAFVMETNEIVFLDFHRFPVGFDVVVHGELLEFIKKEIGPFLAPKTLKTNVTPNQIWESNQTIILGYAEESISSKHEYLWSNVEQAWGNTNDLTTLEQYLNKTIPSKGCTGKFWSAMAHLTATIEDIILQSDIGVRGFSTKLSSKLPYWYHQKSWYSKSMIVSTDYYLASDIIQISIEVNRKNAVCVQI